MIKPILLIALLILVPTVISESFSFLSGDMIDQNFGDQPSIADNLNSEIIEFNDLPNEQNLKRYLIFGKGSPSELGNITTDYSISS